MLWLINKFGFLGTYLNTRVWHLMHHLTGVRVREWREAIVHSMHHTLGSDLTNPSSSTAPRPVNISLVLV